MRSCFIGTCYAILLSLIFFSLILTPEQILLVLPRFILVGFIGVIMAILAGK